jgi:ketosteroid isomerase-like protein
VSPANVEIIRSLLPPSEADIAQLFRDEGLYEATSQALASVIDPGIESIAVWQGGVAHQGIAGFRDLWLDWLEPWVEYHTHVDEVIDAGDRVVVLVQDRGRREGLESEVTLLSGSVWHFRDGRIIRVEFCRNQAEALALGGIERPVRE